MISQTKIPLLRSARLLAVAPLLIQAGASDAAPSPRRAPQAVPATKVARPAPPPPAAGAATPAARASANASAQASPVATPAAVPSTGPAPGEEDARDARIRALEEALARLQERLAQPDKDERIRALEETVASLEQRLEALAQPGRAVPGPEEPATPTPDALGPAPEETAPEIPPGPATGRGAGATLLPNISGVGNIVFRGGSKGTEDRGRFNTQEVELAFQDRVAPNLRADFFLAAEKEADWTTEVEEAFLTWSNPFGMPRLSARLGKVRTPFGKLNPQHPHQRRFVDQPSVISAFLGPDGLNSDGGMLQYLLPFGSIFANLEVGAWQTRSEAEDGLGFAGFGRDAFSARLWLSRAVGRDRELELGFSRYQGRGPLEGVDETRRLAISGVDLTYRAYPGAYRRFVLQGEAIQHHTSGPGQDRNRWGGYLDLAYRPNQYYEGGLRGDSTRLPFPQDGQESAISAYLTRFLTEQTSMRLQVRHGSRPEKSGFTEVFVQFLFGFGPHVHLLQ